ncbi:MAG TPA: M20/M25/M40 family metallo-hydrolase [Thermoplasmata archaeon]|nr:M20/M25/M40 family metallo-hydrolase [Thermoplasmata archaeon]
MDEADALLELVRRYSPSGKEAAAVRAFLRVARRLGFRARTDAAGNGIARRGSGEPRLVFLGHIDTVPGRRPVRRRAGRITGRGSVDAKGALAAALCAGAGFAGPGTYEVVAAVEEETESRGARHLARARPARLLIAGEPSRWDGVNVGYRGRLTATVRFEGERRHPASPVTSPVDRARAWIGAAVPAIELRDPRSPFHSRTWATTNWRSGGDDRQWAEVDLDVRIPPGDSTEKVLAGLRSLGPYDRIVIGDRVEPYEAARDDPVLRAFVAAIRAEGGRPTLWRKSGTSDLNIVAPKWRARGIAFGPGDPRLDHTPGESVRVDELARATRVLRRAIDQLVSASSTSAQSPSVPVGREREIDPSQEPRPSRGCPCPPSMLRTKRIYDPPAAEDGRRVLVDRLWPRGLTKERARVDDWRRDLAPSPALRTWYGHDPERYPEFRERFRGELAPHRAEMIELAQAARRGNVTLVHAAKDAQHCTAGVLKELIDELSASRTALQPRRPDHRAKVR